MEQNKHMPNRSDEVSTKDMHFEAVCSDFIKLLAYFSYGMRNPGRVCIKPLRVTFWF